MAGSTANIVIGAPTGQAILSIANNASPGVVTDVGFCKDGVTITPNFETYRVEGAEGYPAVLAMRRTKTEYTVKSTLMEPTLTNIQKAWDTYLAGVSDPTSPLNLTATSTVKERKIQILSNKNLAGGTRTITFWRAVVESPGECKVSDYEASFLPVTFVCMLDTTASPIGVGTIADT
jgi:hypothetical protein